MKMFIYSKFGVLDCEPMTLQAIENSIPVGTNSANQDLQGAPSDDAQVIEASADSSELEKSD